MKNTILKNLVILASIFISTLWLIGCNSLSSVNEVNQKELEDVPFEIRVLNTGKSDCILIKINDKSIMIDTGLNKNGEQICELLKEKQIDTLEYLIITHLDKDHIGGADTVLNAAKVNNLIQPDYVKESKQYDQYVNAINKNNIDPAMPHEDIHVQIGDAKIKISPALKYQYEKSNDYSIIVGIEYGKYNFLFAGDSEEERLIEFLNNDNKSYTFLKLPHHGRYNSVSEKFLKSISPRYSVITCSEEEMPDNEIISVLSLVKSKTFLTKDGDVTIKTDGESISIDQNNI
ncbi:MBL fold metallo-hydrolase [uncultured Clostridium sp.]|uniref:ComEC/Rec2 family competence protein n=1 Tax=uncultured Clostridium sp. TaxID=59620 RepID=UPI0028E8AE62|nr:MBL fold metallo-hydrolase [uncultured Clostridium sp.]